MTLLTAGEQPYLPINPKLQQQAELLKNIVAIELLSKPTKTSSIDSSVIYN